MTLLLCAEGKPKGECDDTVCVYWGEQIGECDDTAFVY